MAVVLGALMGSMLMLIKQGAIILFSGISSLSRILVAAQINWEFPQTEESFSAKYNYKNPLL